MTPFFTQPPHPTSPRRIIAHATRVVGALAITSNVEADTLRESPQRPTARRVSFAEQSVRLGAACSRLADKALTASSGAEVQKPCPVGLCRKDWVESAAPFNSMARPSRASGRIGPASLRGCAGAFTFGRVFMAFYLTTGRCQLVFGIH